jgi:hypothetical protein
MVQSCRAETRSSVGAGGGPFRRRESERLDWPWESRDVEDEFSCFRREMERESVDVRGWRLMDGRISFFCFEAGRISSRSTGTPRETRKRRRMRERIQLGGCKGGGATSCDQREAERGARKMGFSALRGGRMEVSIVSGGKRVFR